VEEEWPSAKRRTVSLEKTGDATLSIDDLFRVSLALNSNTW
jgi:hypothetical protein